VINRASPRRILFHFRVYRKLRRSGLPLAQDLFPNFASYFRRLTAVHASRNRAQKPAKNSRVRPGVYQRWKKVVATKIILRNPALLRCAQTFGKLRKL
jgi:hypothetical protein